MQILVIWAATTACVILLTLSCRFDLEFGKIGEHFAHGRSSQSEVFDDSLLEKLSALAEHEG